MRLRFIICIAAMLCTLTTVSAQGQKRQGADQNSVVGMGRGNGMHRAAGQGMHRGQGKGMHRRPGPRAGWVDSIGVVNRTIRSEATPENFMTAIYDNPAQMLYRHDFRISDVNVSFLNRKEDVAQTLGKGDGERMFGFNAASFLPMPTRRPSAVWGEVHYRNGRIFNPLWNETSDYDFIYPMVQGDAHGGKMRDEMYSFAGGYAVALGKWGIGVDVKYRAELEYRTRDPRPENHISDFDFSLGGTRRLWGKYNLGVNGTVKAYKQRNAVSFSGHNTTPLYQMEGLGIANLQYSGNVYMSYNYEGTRYGGGFQLGRPDKRGFQLYGNYFRVDMDKIVNESSRNYSAVNSLISNRFEGGIGYMDRWNNNVAGVLATASVEKRFLTRNIINGSYSTGFEHVATRSVYNSLSDDAGVKFLWGMENLHNWQFHMQPNFAYNYLRERYNEYISRFAKNEAMKAGLDADVSKTGGRWLAKLTLGCLYNSTLTNTYNMPTFADTSDSETVVADKDAMKAAYIQNIDRMGLDYWKANGGLQIGFTPSKKSHALLYVDATYALYRFEDHTLAHYITAAIGVKF